MSNRELVLILGGGEFASAIAWYLKHSKIRTAIMTSDTEVHLRRSLCYGEAVYTGRKVIEDITASLISPDELTEQSGNNLQENWRKAVLFHLQNREIPVILNQELPNFKEVLQPRILINTLSQSQMEIFYEDFDFVIGLIPFHYPGQDCHIAIETRKNYQIGKSHLKETQSIPDFDYHFFKNSFSQIISPLEGVFITDKNIGDSINQNEPIGKINDIAIRSPYRGQIWGLYYSGKLVQLKQPLSLIYEGPAGEQYREFDFAHRTVAGSVLKEVLRFLNS